MTNFGVELFLKTFLEYARCPAGREAFIESTSATTTTTTTTTTGASQQQQKQQHKKEESTMIILPDNDEFTGFVFKLQANLDPRHRDRMAFIRVCSGVFRKGMKVGHSRMKKSINLSSAQSLFAQERESVIEAYPGDVIGIHNPGLFAIGDTIFTGSNRIGMMILYYTITDVYIFIIVLFVAVVDYHINIIHCSSSSISYISSSISSSSISSPSSSMSSSSTSSISSISS